MNWTWWYLFGFRGRINRAKMWLAVLIGMCWMLFMAVLTGATSTSTTDSVEFDVYDIFRVLDPASYRSLSLADPPSLLIRVIGTPLLVWFYAATSIKRMHDRDKSGWWIIPFFVVPGLYHQFAGRLGHSYLNLLIGLIAFVFVIWSFIEIYCLKGSRRTNRFGPNPLQPIDARPRWQQQSEIETAPHKADPPPWHRN